MIKTINLRYKRSKGINMNLYTTQFIAVVIVRTEVTDIPRPLAESISLDIDIKLHNPKKLANKILLVSIEASNKTNGLISGAM